MRYATSALAAFTLGSYLAAQHVHADPEPLQTHTAQPLRTAAVNSSGTRHDASSSECIKTPEGRLFEQVSFVMRVVHHYDDDEHRCTPSFADYKELVPGVQEPTTACLNSFVKSKGGIFSIGKRGHVTCAMDYRLHPADATAKPTQADGQPPHDTTSHVPGIPADIRLERDTRAMVRAMVPLRAIQYGIDQGIAENNASLPAGFSVTVMDSRFEAYAPDSRTMRYFIDVDVSGPIGARCQVNVAFAIPTASLDNILVQDVGTTADCKTGSLIGQLGNLPQTLSNSIRAEVTKSLGRKLNEGGGTFADWEKEDPEWSKLVRKALVQGSYCDWQGKPGLCLTAGWPDRKAFNDWEAALLAKVPAPEGAIDKAGIGTKLAHYETIARQTRMLSVGAVRFPSGGDAAHPEDGDMALFGGLLCRSGATDGCDLLRNAGTDDGRFWRSPRRVKEADTPDHATFSGDQLRGVLHYFTVTPDKERLRAFLRYLKTQKTFIPGPAAPLVAGYSSCPNRYPNFTCLLSGDDWHALRLLAARYGIQDEMPPDLPAMDAAYGFDYEQLLWQSLITNAGYRLHLVANTALIMRSLGENDPRLGKVIRILNARQPGNPFFAYLLHGPDQRVARLTDAKCLPPDAPRDAFVDWAWQRDDLSERWKVSMVWDCVFMYGLLARDPLPLPTP